jgi:hypothetical protein
VDQSYGEPQGGLDADEAKPEGCKVSRIILIGLVLIFGVVLSAFGADTSDSPQGLVWWFGGIAATVAGVLGVIVKATGWFGGVNPLAKWADPTKIEEAVTALLRKTSLPSAFVDWAADVIAYALTLQDPNAAATAKATTISYETERRVVDPEALVKAFTKLSPTKASELIPGLDPVLLSTKKTREIVALKLISVPSVASNVAVAARRKIVGTTVEPRTTPSA